MHATTTSPRGRVALVAAAVAVSVMGCRGLTFEQTPVHPNPNMDNVTRIEAQEPSEFWEDGRGMRPQVPGTIARGGLFDDPLVYGGVDGDRWSGRIPPAVLAEFDDAAAADDEPMRTLLERGQDRYEIYCTPCHGDAGLADGGIVPTRGNDAPNWAWAVPSLHDERQRAYPVGRLYDIVTNGYSTMPAYRAQIPPSDRWAIAAYVRALQVAYGLPADQVPADIRQ